jgi:hypothetical protein
MPKYLIERELPGAGKLAPDQLRGISQKSCSVLNNLGPQIQWIQSYVTETRSTVCTVPPTKQWSGNTRSRGASLRTKFRRSRP